MSASFSVDMFLPCSSLHSKLRLISIISEACVVDQFAFFRKLANSSRDSLVRFMMLGPGFVSGAVRSDDSEKSSSDRKFCWYILIYLFCLLFIYVQVFMLAGFDAVFINSWLKEYCGCESMLVSVLVFWRLWMVEMEGSKGSKRGSV